MEFSPGDLVYATTATGERVLARIVQGRHFHGDEEIVILCDPPDWDLHQSGRKPGGYWEEWQYPWLVDALELSTD